MISLSLHVLQLTIILLKQLVPVLFEKIIGLRMHFLKSHQQNSADIPAQEKLSPTYHEQYHSVEGNVLMDRSWKTKVITIILIFLFKCMKN